MCMYTIQVVKQSVCEYSTIIPIIYYLLYIIKIKYNLF